MYVSAQENRKNWDGYSRQRSRFGKSYIQSMYRGFSGYPVLQDHSVGQRWENA